ncbi:MULTISPECIES: MaoC family dehydratase [Halorhodospira]|uniref:MaoC family dehydratase n=1 Tax=Halorhodospira TaxID=85108 RepID=UPI001EE94277|nr:MULTISPECIES: MaoC family dehydratase [Halorhodospira]MCG5526963.1 MaoC family dehydratase [Halorhodospira halophila]MCG5542700.1 MaoC family dehydratase [Halorhodospira sp. 9628]
MVHELQGYCVEDLEPGMAGSYTRTVTEADLVLFAGLSGDNNPVHINEEFASTTFAKGRIAHGLFLGGLISCVLGTRMPGPGAIYLGQQLRFQAPVRIGDTVRAEATVIEVERERHRVRLDTRCYVRKRTVLTGEAEVMVNSREV